MASIRNKILVLIADDEANLLLLLKDNLEENGFEVLTAVNGEEALQMAVQGEPDLIILDVEMPKLNGWQVCEKLRQTPNFESVPILILSAYTQNEDIKKGLSVGVNKHIAKPFRMRELMECVEHLCENALIPTPQVRPKISSPLAGED